MKCFTGNVRYPLLGFSLVEATVGLAIFGIAAAALLVGVCSICSNVQAQKETLRASQIMTEKLDTLRLYSWTQLTTPGFITNTFQASYYPTNLAVGTNCASSPGVTYTGTLTITNLAAS